jgi:hypothetical protein
MFAGIFLESSCNKELLCSATHALCQNEDMLEECKKGVRCRPPAVTRDLREV